MGVRALVCGAALAAMTWAAVATAQAASSLDTQADAGQAAVDYCGRSLGTWFYCERPKAPQTKKPDAPAEDPMEANAKALEAFQKELETAKNAAVWEPTPENIRHYYELQQVALDRATLFQDNWKRLIWENPALDYTLKRPINTLGKRVWQDSRDGDRDLFLRGAAEKVGLFYVFRGDCPACRVASPIVRNFSDRYGVPVTAVSGDGAGNENFAKVVTDQGQLKAWGIGPATPAMLVFQAPDRVVAGRLQPTTIRLSGNNTVTLRSCKQPKGCLTYIGAGVMSVEDIAERLYVLLAIEPGKDY